MESKKPVLKYKVVGGFEFRNVMQKIANTPTSASAARALRAIINDATEKATQVSSEYKETVLKENFKHDEKGEPILENGDFVLLEGKVPDEVKNVTEAFGEKSVELVGFIRPWMLNDVKNVTAKEMEAIGDLISEEDGPGIPHGATGPRLV